MLPSHLVIQNAVCWKSFAVSAIVRDYYHGLTSLENELKRGSPRLVRILGHTSSNTAILLDLELLQQIPEGILSRCITL
jgi:hypothetical protein